MESNQNLLEVNKQEIIHLLLQLPLPKSINCNQLNMRYMNMWSFIFLQQCSEMLKYLTKLLVLILENNDSNCMELKLKKEDFIMHLNGLKINLVICQIFLSKLKLYLNLLILKMV